MKHNAAVLKTTHQWRGGGTLTLSGTSGTVDEIGISRYDAEIISISKKMPHANNQLHSERNKNIFRLPSNSTEQPPSTDCMGGVSRSAVVCLQSVPEPRTTPVNQLHGRCNVCGQRKIRLFPMAKNGRNPTLLLAVSPLLHLALIWFGRGHFRELGHSF